MPRPTLALPLLALLLLLAFCGHSYSVNKMLIPPLDDAFIHFQYARVAAAGAPFEYLPGEGFSSGATSLLWPFLLAPGVWLGLSGLQLYLWALLLSVIALAFGALHLFKLLEREQDVWAAWSGSVALLVCGPVLWGAFSGMEVGILVGAMLIALESRHPLALGVLSMIRPEGMIVAWILAGWKSWEEKQVRFGLWVPASMGLLQPLLNQLGTGLWLGSSVLSKQAPHSLQASEVSPLGFAWDTLIGKGYLDVLLGVSGWPLLALLALGLLSLVQRNKELLALVLLVGWLVPTVAIAATIPILINLGRYLIPGLALWVPAAAIGAAALDTRLSSQTGWRGRLCTLILPILMLPGTFEWAYKLADGATDIKLHHLAAAEWLSAHTQADETVAVNDAGFVPYLTDRKILDLNGIVSQDALRWTLAGEGSVFSLIRRERPSYLVLFPGWFLTLDTSGSYQKVWSSSLIRRTTSGGMELFIARPIGEIFDSGGRPLLASVWDGVDVSDLISEEQHGYGFEEDALTAGRGNVVVAGSYPDGGMVVEGARRHPGYVRATLRNGEEIPGQLGLRLCNTSGEVRLKVKVGDFLKGLVIPRIEEGSWRDLVVPLQQPARSVLVELLVEESAPGLKGGLCLARLEWGPRAP